MGSKESKQACISYEDAVKRVSEAELLRLQDAFKKSAGVGRLFLTRNAFQREVLFEGVPTDTTNLLYSACGGTAKGITFKDLLCGLVLLTRGTQQEKVKFLWNLYCNDSGSSYIFKSDFLKACANPHSKEINSLFGSNDRVGFDQFQSWIVEHKTATVLSQWLLCEEAIKLTSDLEAPTFYQSLAGVTHLEEKDIGDLEKEFWRLKNLSPNGQLDLQLLGPLISPPIPKSALQGLFNAFDENRDGHIDFKELCCGASAACRGPTVERTRFCFKIFDIDSDGILNNEETLKMIMILLYVAKENRNANIYKGLTKDDVVNDIVEYTSQCRDAKMNNDDITVTTTTVTSQNIILTAEDFMIWSVESSLKLIQPFLDLTFEVCHIVFGLWPQCRHIEYEIVRGWLKREEKRQQRVGRFWYLIARDWWLSWLHYTQSIGSSCEHCKTFSNPNQCHVNGVDEALVCDESFNSNSIDSSAVASDNCSLDSASSGISTGLYSSRPGPIDNTTLIVPNNLSNVPSLTGEGGHLRRDTPLMQGRDFELIPKSLWKAFNRWYGDTLPLPRQMIQPPNSAVVELELYPLNLKILRHQYPATVPTVRNWSSIPGSYGMMASGYAAITDNTTTTPTIQPPPKRYLAYTAAFSHLATVKQIAEFLCQQLNLKLENIRLWHIPSDIAMLDNNTILLEEDHLTLQALIVKDKDQILVEIRNKDLTWPEELSSLAQNNNMSNGDRRLTRASVLSVHAQGATGLHNLGNTCFMNAALQVLFNTQPLAQYFRRNLHQFELNRCNKLGTRGILAERYGELLSEVWTTNTRSIAPLKLRVCVTKFAPQFSGGGQHDSQELLEWFLDALHEDLNRVTDKPYTELNDSNGRPDEIVAAEAWSQHHSRNQSIVIDLFYGQLKSKVSCLGCKHESVRFDPFSLLSLPLPVENYIYCEVLVMLLDGTVPVKYGIRLNSESKYIDLKNHIAPLCSIPPYAMLVCEINNSQVSEILSDQQKIKTVSAKDLYIYQLPELNDDDQSFSSSTTFGLSIEQGLKDIQRNSAGIKCCKDVLLKSSSNALLPTESDTLECNIASTINNTEVDNYMLCGRVCDNDDNNLSESHNTQGATKQSSDICRSPNDTPFAKIESIGKKSSTCKQLLQQQTSETSLTIDAYENSMYNSISTEPPISMGPLPSSSRQNSPRNPIRRSTRNTTQSNQNVNSNETTNRCAPDTLPVDDQNVYWRGVPSSSNFNRGHHSAKYLIAVHRKITRIDSYFLSHHKTRPSLFGCPILVPLCQTGAYKDLYCAVWMQVSRLLSPLPASMEQANHAADCDDSLGYDFPFTLRAVRKDGVTCALCPWSMFCRGCEIPCKNEDHLSNELSNNGINNNAGIDTLKREQYSVTITENIEAKNDMTKLLEMDNNFAIAIDWDPTALHLRYQSTLERLWTEHETVHACRKEQTEPVDLDHCLRAFTAEEKLEEWYHCSHCRGKKPATKKLQIWKLPPILIIHLKRFNFVNERWVKSQKSVHFPFDNFDPTPYLAAVPQETIMRHKELLETGQTNRHSTDTATMPIGINNNLINGNGSVDSKSIDDGTTNSSSRLSDSLDSIDNDDVDETNSPTPTPQSDDPMAPNQNTNHAARHSTRKLDGKRKRLESTSLMRTPVIDGEFEDYHQHRLKPDEDVFDAKYKLYAVVCHSGMLNGGHYVSYASNQNGTWYCYNDSSCREISSQPHIDPNSAYLLFYERRGLDYEPYLPNKEGRTIASDGSGGDTSMRSELLDECDNDLKKSCTVS